MTAEQAEKVIMLLQSIDAKVSTAKIRSKVFYKKSLSIYDYLTKKYAKSGNHQQSKRK